MDHISDSFLETNVPLLVLIEAAKSGNEKEVKEYAQVFREHANKLVEVSQERLETRICIPSPLPSLRLWPEAASPAGPSLSPGSVATPASPHPFQ